MVVRASAKTRIFISGAINYLIERRETRKTEDFQQRTLERAPTYIARIAMEHVPPYDDIYTDGLSRPHADHDVTI